jgi:hypothetical protein
MKSTVTRHPKGQHPKEVRITSVHIPDLWHIAMALKELSVKNGNTWMDFAADEVLEAWHIAHDLKDHVIDSV